jgi:hypothetical protein
LDGVRPQCPGRHNIVAVAVVVPQVAP